MHILSTQNSEEPNDILLIGKSFTEAEKALQYHLIENNKYIFFYDEVDVNQIYNNEEYSYPYDVLKKLSLQIRNGAFESVKTTLKELVDSFVKKDYPIFITRCIIFDIYNMLIKTAVETNMDLQFVINQCANAFASKKQDNLEQLFNMLGNISEDLCRNIKQRQINDDGLLSQMYQYINEKYTDYDFSVETMAKHFNVTSNHLSQCFKEKTGDTISNYLWNLRLVKVKELLVTSEQPVKDIIKMVGYVDVSSFSRKFKNSEGVTPGLYRKKYFNSEK